MCGRFTQHYTWAQVSEFLSVIGAPLNLRPRYNIAPTTEIDVVRLDQEPAARVRHKPGSEIDAKAIRAGLGLSQPAFAKASASRSPLSAIGNRGETDPKVLRECC